MQSRSVPDLRLRPVNDAPVRPDGDFVLYWMTAFRRTGWNYSLQRAAEWATELQKPLVVLEALRCDYPWASDRLHRFILQGMADNARRLARSAVYYYPYLEPLQGGGKGLLRALGDRACAVVGDDFPAFFIPRMLAAAGRELKVRLEAADSNGLLPLRAADRVFPTAYAFRRFLQRTLPGHLVERPQPDPLKGRRFKRLRGLPREISRRWPPVTGPGLAKGGPAIAALPIDHGVSEVKLRGGAREGRRKLRRFLEGALEAYPQMRNQPEAEGTSGLSPYLHFGHLSVHEVFSAVMDREDWFFDKLSEGGRGSRQGWWGMSEAAEAFLDQLVTWRELGFNLCWQRADYDRYGSLPAWAQATLGEHAADSREYRYALKDFEAAGTHDPLWNAAQGQLLREGRIHNYLRMLWGKKILEWSASPQQALKTMIELNDKYALDGRDPNSYSGIFWVLGRYDRAWGPERPVFGKIRYMSSENTARKVRVRSYIEKYTP